MVRWAGGSREETEQHPVLHTRVLMAGDVRGGPGVLSFPRRVWSLIGVDHVFATKQVRVCLRAALSPCTMKDLVIDPARIAHALANVLRPLGPRRRIVHVLLLPCLCLVLLALFPLRPPLPPSYADEYRVERGVVGGERFVR